ncbi:MAG TPA: tetratricopeptide repeat protein, partial [Vicinamibacteria bacterium]|nr:tetratricopeptide repeat protein [Vicinamibacteria bacterium]
RLAPSSEGVLSALGEAALAEGAPLEAVSALSILARICPTVAGYRYQYGVALARAGDPAAAIETLREADHLEPNRPATLLALGSALVARQLFAEAVGVLAGALSLAPDDLEAAARLAEAEAGADQPAKAEAHAQQVLGRLPGDATANLAMGMVRMQQGRYEEARTALARSLAGHPDSANAHYQMSLVCARLHDEAAAQQQLSLYRREVEKGESRLHQVRALTGFSGAGTQR